MPPESAIFSCAEAGLLGGGLLISDTSTPSDSRGGRSRVGFAAKRLPAGRESFRLTAVFVVFVTTKLLKAALAEKPIFLGNTLTSESAPLERRAPLGRSAATS